MRAGVLAGGITQYPVECPPQSLSVVFIYAISFRQYQSCFSSYSDLIDFVFSPTPACLRWNDLIGIASEQLSSIDSQRRTTASPS